MNSNTEPLHVTMFRDRRPFKHKLSSIREIVSTPLRELNQKPSSCCKATELTTAQQCSQDKIKSISNVLFTFLKITEMSRSLFSLSLFFYLILNHLIHCDHFSFIPHKNVNQQSKLEPQWFDGWFRQILLRDWEDYTFIWFNFQKKPERKKNHFKLFPSSFI